MKVIIKIWAALALSALTAGAAHAADPFTGEWGGNECGPKAQCWLEVAKKGKKYNVSFVAADRMDASRELCRVKGVMERGPIRYGPHESYDDGLSGEVLGSITYVAPVSDGSLILGGGLTAGLACGKFIMQQIYFPIGD